MKIQLISDIHLEFEENYEMVFDVLRPQADYLFICGDIGYYKDLKHLEKFFDWIKPKWKQIICVLGNHDFYGLNFNQVRSFESKTIDNITIMGKSSISLEDFDIIGTTLWSHIPEIYHHHLSFINFSDFRHIKNFYPMSFNVLYKEQTSYLREQISLNDRPKIILSHHIPGEFLVHPQFEGNIMNSLFASNATKYLQLKECNVKAWLYGHTHIYNYAEHDSVKYIVNPFGYSHEWELQTPKNYTIEIK